MPDESQIRNPIHEIGTKSLDCRVAPCASRIRNPWIASECRIRTCSNSERRFEWGRLANEMHNTNHVITTHTSKMAKIGSLGSVSTDHVFLLIDLFESHPCLWDVKSAEYRNQQLKRAAFTSVRLNFMERTGIECTGWYTLSLLLASLFFVVGRRNW